MAVDEKHEHAGGAIATVLTAAIDHDTTTLSVEDATGWPTTGPFYATIDRGTASEERIEVASRTGTTLTVAARGVDGTSALAHALGASITHGLAAVEAEKWDEHVHAADGVHGIGPTSNVVGTKTSQELENKTIDGDKNTLIVPLAQVTGLAAALNAKATPQDIADAVDAVVDGAPNDLDTLKKIADALGSDPDLAGTLTAAIATKQDAISGDAYSPAITSSVWDSNHTGSATGDTSKGWYVNLAGLCFFSAEVRIGVSSPTRTDGSGTRRLSLPVSAASSREQQVIYGTVRLTTWNTTFPIMGTIEPGTSYASLWIFQWNEDANPKHQRVVPMTHTTFPGNYAGENGPMEFTFTGFYLT